MVGGIRRIVPAGVLIALLVVAGLPQASAEDDTQACRLSGFVTTEFGSIPLIPVMLTSYEGNPAAIVTVVDPAKPKQLYLVVAEFYCPNLVAMLLECIDQNVADPEGFLECTDVYGGS